ncbi:MAG: bifunctional riboflavin kinase/FAD synthetase [Neisseria sp.]|nr:bifunctional riboflavin kinase/FAD synthetase [Neisseria sp.]
MTNTWLGTQAMPVSAASAVSIGNFDGVHSGHRRILQRLREEADARGLKTTVIVFEPQPNEFFARKHGREAVARLTPLRDKLSLLRQTGCADNIWVLRFNHHFSQLPPETFIRDFLIERLGTRYLLVGDDFRFGKDRAGGFELLAAQPEFVTERTPSILIAGERASSTAVRQALAEGRLKNAEQILGHGYALSGRVKHGKKLGRTLGVPTANVHLPPHRYAPNGVFVVSAESRFGQHAGVASFGVNPTTDLGLQQKLEVHLLDFNGDLYRERLTVRFLHKLRDEAAFDSLDALKEQIFADIQAARAFHRL